MKGTKGRKDLPMRALVLAALEGSGEVQAGAIVRAVAEQTGLDAAEIRSTVGHCLGKLARSGIVGRRLTTVKWAHGSGRGNTAFYWRLA